MSEWISDVGNRIDVEVLEESALAMAQATIQNAIDESKLSRAALARRMDCPRSFVTRMLCGNHNLTVRTMSRALAACGSEVRFETVPIVWNWGTTATTSSEVALPAHAGSAMPIAEEAMGIALPA
jgi:hypothetical protein